MRHIDGASRGYDRSGRRLRLDERPAIGLEDEVTHARACVPGERERIELATEAGDESLALGLAVVGALAVPALEEIAGDVVRWPAAVVCPDLPVDLPRDLVSLFAPRGQRPRPVEHGAIELDAYLEVDASLE